MIQGLIAFVIALIAINVAHKTHSVHCWRTLCARFIEVSLASIATRMVCLSLDRTRSERGRGVRLTLRKGLRAEVIR